METEVLVIGSGIAGLTAAIRASENGFRTVLLSKARDLKESNSYYAQGGIVYNRNEKDPSALIRDVARAGGSLVKRSFAEIISREGARCVEDLLIRKARVPFAKKNGGFLLTREAVHSKRRILFASDTTGRFIIERLLEYASSLKNLKMLNNMIAVDILTRDHHTDDIMAAYEKPEALGCYVYNTRTRKVSRIISMITILATGGTGRIYRHTSNPEIATGDGIAMAGRAGAKIINMEYTQFHPTTLFTHGGTNFLLSESIRGEGAVLVNQAGREFIDHPLGSLAPRDIVSISIHNELLSTHRNFVYLDLSGMAKQKIRERFPNIHRECLKYKIDITRDPIPVVPAFHFQIGGVRVNEWGRTNVTNLFATGECACSGLHGANRLASMSLLEGLTLSHRIIQYLTRHRKNFRDQKFPRVREWVFHGVKEAIDPALLKQDWESLQNTMWNYVGIVRSAKRLNRAMTDLQNLNISIEDFYRSTVVTREIIQLRNAVQAGLLIAQAAWQNKVSRGCHYRIN